MSSVGDLVAHLRLDSQPFSKGLANSRGSLLSFAAVAGGVGGAVSSMAGAAIGGISSLASSIVGMGTSSLSLAADAEQNKIAFEVMLGSAEQATNMIGQLQKYADKSPFDTAGVQEGAKKLLNYGVAAGDILPTIEMLGDVAAGDMQKFDGLSTAFGQMSATGRLMGQDLNQFINAGFNPLQEIAAKTGESMGTLKKRMEAGGVSADEVRGAFKKATSEGGRFFGMTARQSQTIAGKFSTMKDGVSAALRTIGQDLTERLDLSGWLDTLSGWLSQVPALFKSTMAVVGPLVQSALSAVSAYFQSAFEQIQQTFGVVSWDDLVAKATAFGSWLVETTQATWGVVSSIGLASLSALLGAFTMLKDGADAALQYLGQSIGVNLDLSTAVAGVSDAVASVPFFFRNASPLIESSVIDWNLSLFKLVPGMGDVMGKIGSFIISTFDGIKAAFMPFIQNVIDGFKEIGKIAVAVWSGIKATFTKGSFTAGFNEAIKEFSYQTQAVGPKFTTEFSKAFSDTMKNTKEGFVDQGGYENSLKNQKVALAKTIAANEESHVAEKASAAKTFSNEFVGPVQSGELPAATGAAATEEAKKKGKKDKENEAALAGSKEAAKILTAGGGSTEDLLGKQLAVEKNSNVALNKIANQRPEKDFPSDHSDGEDL
jgi:tape measure domain-containing protein